MITLYMAYRLMPLSDASSIYLSSPVFVTIFAYIMLKEPITIVQGVTGSLTVIGVFVISKPEFLFGAPDEVDMIYESRTIGKILIRDDQGDFYQNTTLPHFRVLGAF